MPKDKFSSLKILILQLQLTLKFSQINEIQSAYSDFLLFFAEYSFLFETSPTETSLSQSTYTPSDTSFSSQDPARDGGNWWNYCNSNPVKFTDPDGRKIEIDESGGEDFVKDVRVSIEYLKDSEIGANILKKLEEDSKEFVIKKCDWKNSFDEDRFDGDKTIYWSSRHSIIVENGEYNSPAVCLMHELTHAWGSKTSNGQKNFSDFCKDNEDILQSFSFQGKSEEFATAVERIVALQLGEPGGRRNYNDIQREQEYAFTIVLPAHSPLKHSRSK